MFKIQLGIFCLAVLAPTAAVADLADAIDRRADFLYDELALDVDQSEELREILAQQGERRGGASGSGERGSSSAGNAQAMETQFQNAQSSIEALLNERQVGEYRDLVESEQEWWLDPQLMQMDGMLDLDRDQCRMIHPVLRRSRIRLRSLGESARASGDRGAIQAFQEELRDSNEVLLEFLDEPQQEIWEQHIEEQKKQMEEQRSQRDGRGGGGRGGAGKGGRGGGF